VGLGCVANLLVSHLFSWKGSSCNQNLIIRYDYLNCDHIPILLAEQIFKLDQVYKRSDIHDKFGGNRQGGISPSSQFPFIFIFSGKSGHQHGYKDQWENHDVFSYTGEGQLNDMQFVRGNLAIRDHLKNGRRVFLFIQEQKAFVRFESELELVTIDFFQGPDREGAERTAIKFFFKRAGVQLDVPKEELLNIAAERAPNYFRNTPTETERKGLVTSRVGQGAYRKSILFRWNFRCAVSRYSKKEILIASHIVPWKDATNDERLDVANGILLSPTYDALFDRHLISFENNGKIILSDALQKTEYDRLHISGKEKIKDLSIDNHGYLDKHRKQCKF
jgi:5-methylcytosine-specific restriction enzyme A